MQSNGILGQIRAVLSKWPVEVTLEINEEEILADLRYGRDGSEQMETIDDTAPRNTVLAQTPAADSEVDKGSAVDLTLSAGPPPVTIPDVRNQPAADAQAALEGLGLVVEVSERTNGNIDAGNAVKTEPAADETVPVGSDEPEW